MRDDLAYALLPGLFSTGLLPTGHAKVRPSKATAHLPRKYQDRSKYSGEDIRWLTTVRGINANQVRRLRTGSGERG